MFTEWEFITWKEQCQICRIVAWVCVKPLKLHRFVNWMCVILGHLGPRGRVHVLWLCDICHVKSCQDVTWFVWCQVSLFFFFSSRPPCSCSFYQRGHRIGNNSVGSTGVSTWYHNRVQSPLSAQCFFFDCCVARWLHWLYRTSANRWTIKFTDFLSLLSLGEDQARME